MAGLMDDRLEPRIRILLGSSIAIGPGKATLLEAIGESGSIAAAGRRMGMSYRRAWVLAKAMNACFREPLIEAAKGGIGGGGARLTSIAVSAGRDQQRQGRALAPLGCGDQDRGSDLWFDRLQLRRSRSGGIDPELT